MAKPTKIGDIYFKTKKMAKDHYKEMLNRYDLGEFLCEMDKEELYWLLVMHPDSETKLGCGVLNFVVRKTDKGTRCFHIVRFDGSEENFSYLKCIDGEVSDGHRFRVACRMAIYNDMLEYRRENYKGDDIDSMCVDHVYPLTFDRLVYNYLQSRNIVARDVEYDGKNNYGHEFMDKELKEDFRDYHKEVANLQIIDRKLNLKKGNRPE